MEARDIKKLYYSISEVSEITGLIPYKYNIEDCYEKMDLITNEILNSINVIDVLIVIIPEFRTESLIDMDSQRKLEKNNSSPPPSPPRT